MRGAILPGFRDLRDVVRRFSEDEGFLLASALSFDVILCLAPFTLILFSVAGFLLKSDAIAEYVFDSATVLVPAYGRQLAEFLVLLTKERTVTGLVGAASLAVVASHVFSVTRTVLNRAFRVRLERGLIRGFVFDVLSVLVVGCGVVAVAFAALVLVALRDLAHRLLLPLPSTGYLHEMLSLPAFYALGLGTLFLVYRTFPNTPVAGRAAAAAAVGVAVLWELARRAFATYIDVSGVYGRFYGSFGIWVAALVWIYYSSIIFVLGAELAAVLTERSRPEPAPPPAASHWPPDPAATRGRDSMALKYAIVAVVAVAITVFALQNTAPATVRFVAWTLAPVPIAAVVLAAVGAGLLIAGVPLGVSRLRAGARARQLEARVRELEAGERDRARTPPPDQR